MAFFKNIESTDLYFSPIFHIKNKHICSGKLCIIYPSARKFIFLLPLLAAITSILTLTKLFSMIPSIYIQSHINIEIVNIFVMTASLLPGALTTAIAFMCQIPSIKNKKYYKESDGSVEINIIPSLSMYLTYSFLLINIFLCFLWLNKNPKYNGDEIPFFHLVTLIILIISIFLWSRIFWIFKRSNDISISWKDSFHF